MADQGHNQQVVGLGRGGDLLHLGLESVASGLCAVERDGDTALGQQFVEILRKARKALLVVRLAAEAGDGDVPRVRRGSEAAGDRKVPHTAPQRRRSSHSADFSPASNSSAAGMSQRSCVSRTVNPASESEITSNSDFVSSGLK